MRTSKDPPVRFLSLPSGARRVGVFDMIQEPQPAEQMQQPGRAAPPQPRRRQHGAAARNPTLPSPVLHLSTTAAAATTTTATPSSSFATGRNEAKGRGRRKLQRINTAGLRDEEAKTMGPTVAFTRQVAITGAKAVRKPGRMTPATPNDLTVGSETKSSVAAPPAARPSVATDARSTDGAVAQPRVRTGCRVRWKRCNAKWPEGEVGTLLDPYGNNRWVVQVSRGRLGIVESELVFLDAAVAAAAGDAQQQQQRRRPRQNAGRVASLPSLSRGRQVRWTQSNDKWPAGDVGTLAEPYGKDRWVVQVGRKRFGVPASELLPVLSSTATTALAQQTVAAPVDGGWGTAGSEAKAEDVEADDSEGGEWDDDDTELLLEDRFEFAGNWLEHPTPPPGWKGWGGKAFPFLRRCRPRIHIATPKARALGKIGSL